MSERLSDAADSAEPAPPRRASGDGQAPPRPTSRRRQSAPADDPSPQARPARPATAQPVQSPPADGPPPRSVLAEKARALRHLRRRARTGSGRRDPTTAAPHRSRRRPLGRGRQPGNRRATARQPGRAARRQRRGRGHDGAATRGVREGVRQTARRRTRGPEHAVAQGAARRPVADARALADGDGAGRPPGRGGGGRGGAHRGRRGGRPAARGHAEHGVHRLLPHRLRAGHGLGAPQRPVLADGRAAAAHGRRGAGRRARRRHTAAGRGRRAAPAGDRRAAGQRLPDDGVDHRRSCSRWACSGWSPSGSTPGRAGAPQLAGKGERQRLLRRRELLDVGPAPLGQVLQDAAHEHLGHRRPARDADRRRRPSSHASSIWRA